MCPYHSLLYSQGTMESSSQTWQLVPCWGKSDIPVDHALTPTFCTGHEILLKLDFPDFAINYWITKLFFSIFVFSQKYSPIPFPTAQRLFWSVYPWLHFPDPQALGIVRMLAILLYCFGMPDRLWVAPESSFVTFTSRSKHSGTRVSSFLSQY